MNLAPAVLSGIPLFQSLPAAELDRLTGLFQRVELAAGEVLFHQGDPGASFYLIQSGLMEVIQGLGTPDEHVLVARGPGEYFGEMSLIRDEHTRIASLRARSAAALLELSKEEFIHLLERNPRVAFDMVRLQTDRLNESSSRAMRTLQTKNAELRQAYEDLQAAQAQIIEKEKLEYELGMARKIQMSLLPRERPAPTGYELGAVFLPMHAVGGDFYDFIELDERRLGIVIGDVSGHGVPAALVMALSVALVRAAACLGCAPDAVLRAVNAHLGRLIAEGMFVTALYGVLDCERGEFVFARAGHNPPLLARAGGQVDEAPIFDSMMLGILPDSPVSLQTLRLGPGDQLLLVTDGVNEARGEGRELFGDDRLRDALRGCGGLSAQATCEHILARAAAFSGQHMQSDDITLICIQARADPSTSR